MRQCKKFQRAIEQIRAILNRYKPDRMVVYLFGSSVRDDHTEGSDIDISIASVDRERIAFIRVALEESTIL